jgi:sortase A
MQNNPKLSRKKRIVIFLDLIIDLLIIGALVYMGLVYGPFLYYEADYYLRRLLNKSYKVVEDIDYGPKPAKNIIESIVQKAPEIAIEPKSKEFGIIIEKIGVNEEVIQDVDLTDKKGMDSALKRGVAHAKGTAYPGELGNVYLFSHSTVNVWDIWRYRSPFTLLRKLENGDQVIIFYKEQRYDYIVYEKKVVNPDSIEDLTGFAEEPTLTLQTCEPPGSNKYRLIVKARLED